jgi:hypothetical protein
MLLVRSHIAISLEKSNLFWMAFQRDRIQGQHTRFLPDGRGDFFLQGRLVRFQLIRINFQLCDSHDPGLGRLRKSTPDSKEETGNDQ